MKKTEDKTNLQKWPNLLILVRHGQSIYNEERELINRGIIKTYTAKVKKVRNADLSLSKLGKFQARKTGAYLKKEYGDFDVVFTSPFKRAYETAKIIAKNFPKAKFIVEERIREKEFGMGDGLTAEEIKDLFPYEYARRLKESKYYYRPIGGESYPDVNLRIWSFLTTMVREYSKAKILVVCHSAIMLGFRKNLEKFNEAQILKINREDDLKNCAIISYKYNPDLKPKPKMKLDDYNKIVW